MHPTSSFLGKCLTVLIGMGLSWATMTNPQAEQVARHFFGPSQRDNVVSELDSNHPSIAHSSNSSPRTSADVSTPREASIAVDTPLVATFTASSLTDEQRIDELSRMLRELGATYLRVEKMTKSGETCFRVRCDLARESDRLKCCLEATGATAVAAMEDVLRAAEGGIETTSAKISAAS